MFGYITINKPEIRFKDFYRFRSYYCGLCCELKKKHGQMARLSIGFDMTFLAVLLSGLYDTETRIRSFRCMAHPFRKRPGRTNEFTSYAADMNLLLVWHKCMDDWQDEKKFTRLLYAKLIGHKVKKTREQWPEKSAHIAEALHKQYLLEKENCTDIDEISGCFGSIISEIFAYRSDVWEEKLRRMGYYLGKYIYLLDAYDDVYEDEANHCYNPFIGICHDDDFDERVEAILSMMISESAAAFEMLPVDDNMELLRNIIYSGVWRSFELIQIKRKGEAGKSCKEKDKENDGSI